MNRYIAFGLRTAFRGARQGQPGMAALGALALGFGLFKRFATPRPELVFSTRLKPGQGLRLQANRLGDLEDV